jgi:FMN-dependent oxidoreductase (nitrilotriacetate monooxygenase family)
MTVTGMPRVADVPQRAGMLKLGMIVDGAGTTAEGWRRPEVQPDASIDVRSYISQAQRAEQALLDFIFVADTLFISADAPPHALNRLEPLTLLSAVATATSRIGLVATISTLFAEPFTVARQLASLDLISDGRAAWNIVTSAVPAAALNHSRPGDFGLTDRYRRASEHVAVCQGLWDSWEDDAFVYDKTNGIFFDRAKMHGLNFAGEYYQAVGPLNIQRSRQGHPILFQAGASSEGRDLAARYADAIFAMTSNIGAAKAYGDDVRARAMRFGRLPQDLIFMPRISPIIGVTEREVDEAYREATRRGDLALALRGLSDFFGGYDFSTHGLDAPFPDVPIPSAPPAVGKSGANTLSYIETTHPERFARDMHDRGMGLRDAALEFLTPRTAFVGTPESIADTAELWFRSGSADGFIIRGGDFEAFARLCIPILQERGIFRDDYEADTLRGNLGLPFVPNRHAASRDGALGADTAATA